MTGVRVRPAVAADEPAVRACAESAYSRYVAAIGREPAPMVADFAAQIGAGLVHVAVDEAGRLTGFVVFFPKDGGIFLENVAVRPEMAGRGIGGALIRHCEDQARRAGFAVVRLYTNAKMSENLSLYPRLGYVEVERRIEDGFDRVFFEKRVG